MKALQTQEKPNSRAAANVVRNSAGEIVMGDWKRWIGNGEVINNFGSRIRVWSDDDGLYWVEPGGSSSSWGEDVDHVRDGRGNWWKIGWNTAVVDANGSVSGAECRTTSFGEACPDDEITDHSGTGGSEPSDAGVPLPGGVQPKLEANQPNDKFEQEANAVADRVMRAPDSSLQKKCTDCEEEKSLQMKPLVRMKTDSAKGGTQVNSWVQSQIESSRGGGNALPDNTRNFMESRMGADFSGVKIHTGNTSEKMNRELGARAFTVGNDIHFGAGQFSPESSDGQRLLAHELVHTVQQGAAGQMVQRDLALRPEGFGDARNLSKKDIRKAVRFNRRAFKSRKALKIIRDVLGGGLKVSDARSDAALAIGVAEWQAEQGIAIDGKISAVTLLFITEELDAEGEKTDADFLRKNFRRSHSGLADVDKTFCPCLPRLDREIKDGELFIKAYSNCGKDPAHKTGGDIEKCVISFFNKRGISTTTAGTTSSSGKVTVKKQPGLCGPIEERITLAHEQIHEVHTSELKQKHGRGRKFKKAFNDAQDWARDEVNSRKTDIASARFLKQVLERECKTP